MDTLFDEILFPIALSYGAVGGPEYLTETVRSSAGVERRTALRPQALRRYNAAAGVRAPADLYTLLAFFEARCGRLRGFRWRDPFDNSSAPAGGVPTPFDQNAGTGDGQTKSFNLMKNNAAGIRHITKPQTGSVRVAVAGRETSAFTVDYTSGAVTFTTPPPAGAAVTAGFYFHVPVRFDTDYLPLSMHSFNAGLLPEVAVIEVLP